MLAQNSLHLISRIFMKDENVCTIKNFTHLWLVHSRVKKIPSKIRFVDNVDSVISEKQKICNILVM